VSRHDVLDPLRTSFRYTNAVSASGTTGPLPGPPDATAPELDLELAPAPEPCSGFEMEVVVHAQAINAAAHCSPRPIVIDRISRHLSAMARRPFRALCTASSATRTPTRSMWVTRGNPREHECIWP
jgi:hypothetical protein